MFPNLDNIFPDMTGPRHLQLEHPITNTSLLKNLGVAAEQECRDSQSTLRLDIKFSGRTHLHAPWDPSWAAMA